MILSNLNGSKKYQSSPEKIWLAYYKNTVNRKNYNYTNPYIFPNSKKLYHIHQNVTFCGRIEIGGTFVWREY